MYQPSAVHQPTTHKPPATPKGARRRLRLLMFVMLLFLAWAVVTLVGQTGKVNSGQKDLEQLKRELAQVKEKNAQLNLEMVRYNDDEFIGQKARKELNMTKDGETLYDLQE
ncbi:MAG: septum formation initiator family protein [Clostridia bacterium]|nr:septum formation initiator family protein [Clostridia bacterium]